MAQGVMPTAVPLSFNPSKFSCQWLLLTKFVTRSSRVINRLNEAAIDFAPVVGIAKRQVPAQSAPPTVYTTLT